MCPWAGDGRRAAKLGRVRRWGKGRPEDRPIETLLDDVEALRLTLSSDLIVAAAAADAERADIAASVIDSDRDELLAFAARAEQRLAELRDGAVEVAPSTSVRRRVPATSMLAAASLAAIVAAGTIAATSHSAQHATPAAQAHFDAASLSQSYNAFRRVIDSGGSVNEVLAAARRLHQSIAPLIAAAKNDPSSKQEILTILHEETRALQGNHSSGAFDVLAAAQALVAQLTNKVHTSIGESVKHHKQPNALQSPQPQPTPDAPQPSVQPSKAPTKPAPPKPSGSSTSSPGTGPAGPPAPWPFSSPDVGFGF